MMFSRSTPVLAALLAAAAAFGAVVTTADAHARGTLPNAEVPQVCLGDEDLEKYFLIRIEDYLLCAETDFICIGGNGDCNLRLNRFGRNDFAVVVHFRLVAAAGGSEPQVRYGQFAFGQGQASSLVRYRLQMPVRSAEVQLLAEGTVVHREAVTISAG